MRIRSNAAAFAGQVGARFEGHQQFSRLGQRTKGVDVRILKLATNINIPEALASKRLREDLYYRLNAFKMKVPPLRERKEAKIPILLKHFMTHMAERATPGLPCRFSPTLLQACFYFYWPGNIRELNNFVKTGPSRASRGRESGHS